jgi:hypothetical protein
VADPGLDVDVLLRDRARYETLLAQAEEKIRAVQQTIGGIDQLLALAGHKPGAPAVVAPVPAPAKQAATTARKKATPTPTKKTPAKRPAVAANAPKGTEAVRQVLGEDPSRSFNLAELQAELEARRWLAPSRRPEELVRINLKRLAERGGAVRNDDGTWRAASGPAPEAAPEPDPEPDPAAAPVAEDPTPSVAPAQVYVGGPEQVRPSAVGSTVREW